jgi:glycosyltransferase involved in cell wall biosynthesis
MNVSLICACKNRVKPLTISLVSWLFFDEIKEIIIVDWSSDESLDHLMKFDSRIKIVSVPNKTHFNQPQPLNLAASISGGDSILKVDCDHIFNPYNNVLKTYKIDKNSFHSGYPKESPDDAETKFKVESPYFKPLIGFLHVTKENFEKVGGYNENLGEFYGYEDEEIQMRLEKCGLIHHKMNCDNNAFHIPHSDLKRTEYFIGEDAEIYNRYKNDIDQYYSGDVAKYQLEYAMMLVHIEKGKQEASKYNDWHVPRKTKWNVKKINQQKYFAIEV